jgi:hypothetical protein
VQETVKVQLIEVVPFKALAVRTGMTPDKSGTWVAWSKLTVLVPLDDARLAAGSGWRFASSAKCRMA